MSNESGNWTQFFVKTMTNRTVVLIDGDTSAVCD